MNIKIILWASMLTLAVVCKTAGADVVCSDWKAVKQPFFGDMHIHTSYSFDAFEFGNTENDPYWAYYFAKGNVIPIPPFDAGVNQRYTRLDRPLDFAAVTDHAEYLEETEWANIKLAAHLNNDPCYFTTFNGYEYSWTPKRFFMQHRNVIFRNAIVPEMPVSSLEVTTPEGLWLSLFATCLAPQFGCDVVAIPHNTNFTGGMAFRPYPFSIPSPVTFNPGGLAVVWAEQNTRDSIFDGMKQKETYATSGTRPEVRFFAGYDYPTDICSMDADTLAQTGYAAGVPMGSTLGSRDDKSPRFVVFAKKDQHQLQRIQIVKGWTDAAGDVHEKVIDVVGDTSGSASVDVDTCETSGPGYDRLCKLWVDPEYDALQSAFYYARVLENPSCRWSQYECNRQAVDCEQPDSVPAEFAGCCAARIPKTIQERAWTSPIWISARNGGSR